MRFWALILRFLGFTWFVWILVTNLQTILEPYVIFEIELDFRQTAVENIARAAVNAALCFGVAAGLEALARIEARISRQNAALQRLIPSSGGYQPEQPVKRSLAPKAPWDLPEY